MEYPWKAAKSPCLPFKGPGPGRAASARLWRAAARGFLRPPPEAVSCGRIRRLQGRGVPGEFRLCLPEWQPSSPEKERVRGAEPARGIRRNPSPPGVPSGGGSALPMFWSKAVFSVGLPKEAVVPSPPLFLRPPKTSPKMFSPPPAGSPLSRGAPVTFFGASFWKKPACHPGDGGTPRRGVLLFSPAGRWLSTANCRSCSGHSTGRRCPRRGCSRCARR